MSNIIEETIRTMDDSLDYFNREPDFCFSCGEDFIPYESKELGGMIGSCYCSLECYEQWCKQFEHGMIPE